ncbi:hypothetical protein RSAG8_05256, partial [Rhizoctonia solani AG-8 WAC10335]
MSAHPKTDLSIPKTQKVAIFEKAGGPVEIKEAPVVQPDQLEAGQVLVKVLYSGVCHTDLHALLGDWPLEAKLPLIGGHEGSGFVVAIGKGTTSPIKLALEGEILTPNESVCPDAQCSGYTVDGSFQQYAVSYAAHVTPIPESIALDLAAPILCAGVTVFKSFVDFKSSPDIIEEIKKVADGLGPHAAIVASSASAGYDQALQYLRPGGTLVAVGLPPGAKINADVFWTVVRSITVKGSYVGNREDARQALDIAARGRVRTTYRVEPLGKLPEVFKAMKEGKLAGRVVLDLWK